VAVALQVTLTVAGPGASRTALLKDTALTSLRGGVACLSGPGVAPGSVLGTATLDTITAGAAPLPIPAGLPGNVAAPPACAVAPVALPAAAALGRPSVGLAQCARTNGWRGWLGSAASLRRAVQPLLRYSHYGMRYCMRSVTPCAGFGLPRTAVCGAAQL
jgi:hypothetical protein